jgi:hypothetical protein
MDGEDEANKSLSFDDDAKPTSTALLGLDYIENKENVSMQQTNNVLHQKINKPIMGQSQKQQPIESVANTSRDKQLAQKCFDSAMQIMESSSFSTISSDSDCTSNMPKAAFDGDSALNRSIDCLARVREVRELISQPKAPQFSNTVSLSTPRDVNEGTDQQLPTQDDNQTCGVSQNPTSYICKDTRSSFQQAVRSPVPSLANSAALSGASSAVTDLFAALRASTAVAEENFQGNTNDKGVAAERKRWIEETLLSKKDYEPIQTKEREECCRNKDCHDLTTERKRWIEDTLLVQQDTLKRLSPKHSFLANTLAEASNELIVQRKRQMDKESVVSPQETPQKCPLDHGFLASALVATNMLLTPPRREKYSSKARPSRNRLSIGASPHPFSPASAASSVFTETASNIILHALKQLTPKQSTNSCRQGKHKQESSITPSRKSDLLSIAAEMKSLDSQGSNIKEELKLKSEQTMLAERVENLERLVTLQSARSMESDQEELHELRRELHRCNLQLESERQLVEKANHRVSMLTMNLNNMQEMHSNVERQLRDKIQRLEEEIICMRDSERQHTAEQDKANEAASESRALSLAKTNDAELEELRRTRSELLERQSIDDIKHQECRKENENLRSQLHVLSSERAAKEQAFSMVLEFVGSISETFSCANRKLEQGLEAKKDEVTCLRRSLELMSCELVMSTNEVNDLRSENASLKRLKAGKKWPF